MVAAVGNGFPQGYFGAKSPCLQDASLSITALFYFTDKVRDKAPFPKFYFISIYQNDKGSFSNIKSFRYIYIS